MTVKHSGRKEIRTNKDKKLFAMAASYVLIAPRREQYEPFMKYINNLAAELKVQGQ